LILAGGYGLKLRPFTYEMPKAMLPVGGKPILEHIIDQLRHNDIRDIIVSIGPNGEKIREHFGDGSRFGVRVAYIVQEEGEMGTAQAVLQAKSQIGNQPFLLYYGDVLADIAIRDFIDFHIANKSLATMALTSLAQSSDWGVVSLRGMKIIDFSEKPKQAQTHSQVINAGIYLFQPEIFSLIDKQDQKLEQDVLPKLLPDGQLNGYVFEGRWYDVGNTEIYEQAIKEWRNAR
jgi:NDP-sugar pyrophosphorylase family protein